MPKVSIILTIYNAGKYLQDCLETLINQTLKDIEIIIVVDCPTDGSDILVEKFAASDNRIKIIKNSSNIHIGKSRNQGLEIATGEYVAFSDHDDYRELDMYEQLYNLAKKENADFVVGTSVCDTSGVITEYSWPIDLIEGGIKEFVLRDLIGQGNMERPWPLGTNIHPNLYRRAILVSENIKFVDTREIVPEDRLFNVAMGLASDKIVIDRDIRYYHRIFKKSEMHNRSYYDPVKRIRYWDEVYDLLNRAHLFSKYEANFATGIQKNFLEFLYLALFSYRSWKQYNNILRFMRTKIYCKLVFSHPLYITAGITKKKRMLYQYFSYRLKA